MNIYDEAKKWVDAGIAVFPCVGKTPALRTWKPYQTGLPDAEDLRLWFSGGRFKNLAIVTGWRGLAVIDFDNYGFFGEWLADLGNMPETYMVKTSRGVHVYFSFDVPPRHQHFMHIDIQACGAYVIAPPSVHPSGAIYEVLWNSPIKRVRSLEDVLPERFRKPRHGAAAPLAQPPGATLPPEILSKPAPGGTREVCIDPYQAAAWAVSKPSIAEIKARVPILSLLPGARMTGDRWAMVCCPFHDDQHPSMSVDIQNNTCRCQAGCMDKPYDVINLYARMHGVDNRTAIQRLQALVMSGSVK